MGSKLDERHRGPRGAQHALEQASVDGAHQLAVLVQQVAERALAQRDLDRSGAAAPEPRLEPGIGQRLLQHREVGPARAAGRPASARCGPPGRRPIRARAPRRAPAAACSGQQPRQDVGQQPVVAALTALAIHGRVHRLGPAHRGRSPLDLARHQAGILETAQVRAHRVRVQGQPGGELAHGHRPCRTAAGTGTAGSACRRRAPCAPRSVRVRPSRLRRRLDFHGQHRVKRADTI